MLDFRFQNNTQNLLKANLVFLSLPPLKFKAQLILSHKFLLFRNALAHELRVEIGKLTTIRNPIQEASKNTEVYSLQREVPFLVGF